MAAGTFREIASERNSAEVQRPEDASAKRNAMTSSPQKMSTWPFKNSAALMFSSRRQESRECFSKEDEMKRYILIPGRSWFIAALLALGSAAYAQTTAGLDMDGIARAMGKKGAVIDEAYKVTFPRSDLHVKAGKVSIKPALALNSWAAFNQAHYGKAV